MLNKVVIKKVVFPISSAALLTTVYAAAEEKNDEEKKDLVRRKDLSIYPVKREEKPPVKDDNGKSENTLDSKMLSVVKEVRESLASVNKEWQAMTDKVNHVIETGKAHAGASLQMLRDEENYAERYAAIATGGLLGYIIAIRRGWFRKLIYTATGSAAVAAVAYPEEAKEYTSEGFHVAKKYIVVAYHFVNGVLRDYAGVQLPNLPGPLAVGSASAAEKDASTVPSSAALMPHTASTPSHISSGPIPLPPIDRPSSVLDNQG